MLGPDKVSANAVVGTPHFMAPEAVQTPQAIDARSDLYSLGAVGYWLLTGRTLFESGNVEELLDGHVSAIPKRPSDRTPRPVSADLEQIIMSCLAKNAEERPKSAEALDAALARCAAASSWTPQDADKWWTSNLAKFETAPVQAVAEKTLVIARRNGSP